MRAIDITVGFPHERWTVLSTDFRRTQSGAAYFQCQCKCGTIKEVLFRGKFQSKSCGCLQKETTIARQTKHGQATGGDQSRIYRVWTGMRERCSNPNRKEWPNYGGRGIYVAPEWNDFNVFFDWAMSHGYADDLDLNRKDNDGPYSSDNCDFITRKRNLRNTRTNKMVTAFGETKCLAEWAEDERCVVSAKTFWSRLKLDWDVEDALKIPAHNWNPKRTNHARHQEG